MPGASHYIACFMQLHRDVDPQYWSADTLGKAPHKPLLLLCVLDQYATDPGRANRIVPNQELEESFNFYWELLDLSGTPSTFSLPFFHLQTDGFWHLVGVGNKDVDERARRTPRALREHVERAYVDAELHEILRNGEWRSHLKSVLITANFDPSLHERLLLRRHAEKHATSERVT